MKKIFVPILLITCFPLNAVAGYEDTWDSLLKKYTSQGEKNGTALTLVDYKNIRNDKNWLALINELKGAISPVTLFRAGGSEKNRALAFWINIYNIGAVKMMTDNYPLKSIKDKSKLFNAVWDQKIITVSSTEYSLGYIEHEILRKMGQPLIHVAIVCASVSCPDLLRESYQANKLDDQLNAQMKRFLGNKQKGFRLDKEKKNIYISLIFKWFEDDFGNIRKYIAQYLSRYKNELLDKKYNIKYLDYDWHSNE